MSSMHTHWNAYEQTIWIPRASTQVTTNFAIGNDMLRINRNKDFINQIDMIKTLNRLNFSIILDTGV